MLLTVGSALVVLLSRNVLYAAFCLMLTFLGMAALYVTLGADFLAVTQLMIYVGGIVVLIVFGIMLTNKAKVPAQSTTPNGLLSANRNSLLGGILALVIFGGLVWVLRRGQFAQVEWQHFEPQPLNSKVSSIGKLLMTDVSLPFELTGILLLMALMGAAYVAKNR